MADQDYSQMIAMVAKPVISSGLTLLAAAGAIHALPADATVNAGCVFIGALGNAGVWGWAYIHSKRISAAKEQAQTAGYAAGLAQPQTDPGIVPNLTEAAKTAVAALPK